MTTAVVTPRNDPAIETAIGKDNDLSASVMEMDIKSFRASSNRGREHFFRLTHGRAPQTFNTKKTSAPWKSK